MSDYGPIKKIVIVGGGTAGWMSAAAMTRFVGTPDREIILVESEAIGTVGVGEGTIPPMIEFNQMLGIAEPDFLRETKGTYKLGIDFVGWGTEGERYFHPFGQIGRSLDGISFHQIWLKHRDNPAIGAIGSYSLSMLAALNSRFAPHAGDPGSGVTPLAYSYHLDASLYARMLRRYAEGRGLKRIEGRVVAVERVPNKGQIGAVVLEAGERIQGDLFIDCSGFRALLIGQELGVPFDDWSHWLPCDRAIAVPSARVQPLQPYTRAIAHASGWQWRIPLQHRTGNGHVYSSAHVNDEVAERTLVRHLEGSPTGAVNKLQFRAGRRVRQWEANVIAIGLSAGFLEPLESTSIWLIQHAIQRMFALFPDLGFSSTEREEFNRTVGESYERVRDFLILHYQTSRRNEPFWRDVRSVRPPDTLQHKIELFRHKGRIFRYNEELFDVPSWIAVMLGQGISPESYDPLVDSLPDEQILPAVTKLRTAYRSAALALPPYENFLAHVLAAADGRRFGEQPR